MTYWDAHNHLHDVRLAAHRDSFFGELATLPLGGAVVNGTREDDWEAVESISRDHPWITASYGLHPWHAPARSSQWLDCLQERLKRDPRAGVGEIGLDRWIEGHDLDLQQTVLIEQLRLAVEFERPATIHCLRAWGALREVLQDDLVPARGFLLHAYGGPLEMVEGFVRSGAYFSFSPSFLQERKAAQRRVFASIPQHRLLVETDAPDLYPPVEFNPRPICDSDKKPLNHPANIDLAYRGLAEVCGMEVADLEPVIAENYRRLFET